MEPTINVKRTTIVCFYIECKSQVELEKVLYENNLRFVDATEYDVYTKNGSNFPTLECIEADLECK